MLRGSFLTNTSSFKMQNKRYCISGDIIEINFILKSDRLIIYLYFVASKLFTNRRKIVEKIVFDITRFESSIKSLEKLTNINGRELFKYISERKDEYGVSDFLKTFDIDEETLLSKELELVSLHVTTSFDDLATVRDFGLINPQQAVTLVTPFHHYLKKKDIE